MTLTKLKIGIASVIVAAGVATPLIIQHGTLSKLRDQNQSLQAQLDQAGENERLSTALAQSRNTLDDDQRCELLRLRGEIYIRKPLSAVVSTNEFEFFTLAISAR